MRQKGDADFEQQQRCKEQTVPILGSAPLGFGGEKIPPQKCVITDVCKNEKPEI